MEQPERPVTSGQDAAAQGGAPPSDAGAPGSKERTEQGAPGSRPEGGAVPAGGPPGEALEEGAPEESEMTREIESLSAELAEWKEKAEFNWDQFLRARADLDNYRKRVERDIAFRVRLGKRDLLLGFLDVLDNLERVVDELRSAARREPQKGEAPGAGPGEEGAARTGPHWFEAFVTGVEMVKRQMEAVLQRECVRVVECLGKPFDPATQEAVEAVDGPGESGTVAEVVLKGYTYEGDLLRPARVKVVK